MKMDYTIIIKSLYFFLPAYFANMTPVVVRWIPFLKKPIHEKLLGSNKTWRGLFFGTLMGGFIFILQQQIHLLISGPSTSYIPHFTSSFTSLALIDYEDFPVWFGFLQGFGALLGDGIKSYYKRKQKITPGKPWFLWDQLDFVFGGIIVGGFVYFPSAETVLILLLASPLLHLIVNYLGYILKMKKNIF